MHNQFAVRSSQFAVRSSQFAVRSSQFAVRSSQFVSSDKTRQFAVRTHERWLYIVSFVFSSFIFSSLLFPLIVSHLFVLYLTSTQQQLCYYLATTLLLIITVWQQRTSVFIKTKLKTIWDTRYSPLAEKSRPNFFSL
jgi:uncharacterized protein YqhQ